jgi:hypothetical protein
MMVKVFQRQDCGDCVHSVLYVCGAVWLSIWLSDTKNRTPSS